MSRAFPIGAEDPAADCPVPIDVLSRLYRARPDALTDHLDSIPEATRAQLAVYLYGHNHTRQLGIQIAVTCEGASLRRVAGFVGNTLYTLSRQNPAAWSDSIPRPGGLKRVSLGGSVQRTA